MDTPTQELQVIEPRELQVYSVEDLKSRRDLIVQVMKNLMVEGVHYGTVPGIDEPFLKKPGADMLGNTFKLTPRPFTKREDFPNGHREYEITIELVHQVTGLVVGVGMGSCSTLESKFRWRYAARVCPKCQKDTIARGRQEYGGGWYCNTRKGGCAAKFAEDAPEIVNQSVGRVENPDIADQWSNVLKIGFKRAHVAAVHNALAVSDIFSQADQEEDDDESEPRQGQQQNRQQSKGKQVGNEPINQQQIGFLMQTCKECGVPEEVLVDYLKGKGINSRKDIKQNQLNDIIEWVKANKKDAA